LIEIMLFIAPCRRGNGIRWEWQENCTECDRWAVPAVVVIELGPNLWRY
jgi:hypothetical protein